MGYQGPTFTWCNNRLGNARVWERLDRAFASESWIDMFPESKVQHLTRFASDHHPLLMSVSNLWTRKNVPFRFEKIWLYGNGIWDCVRQAWKCDGNFSLATKLTSYHPTNQGGGKKMESFFREYI